MAPTMPKKCAVCSGKEKTCRVLYQETCSMRSRRGLAARLSLAPQPKGVSGASALAVPAKRVAGRSHPACSFTVAVSPLVGAYARSLLPALTD